MVCMTHTIYYNSDNSAIVWILWFGYGFSNILV